MTAVAKSEAAGISNASMSSSSGEEEEEMCELVWRRTNITRPHTVLSCGAAKKAQPIAQVV